MDLARDQGGWDGFEERGVTIMGIRDGQIAWGRLYLEETEREGADITETVRRMAGREALGGERHRSPRPHLAISLAGIGVGADGVAMTSTWPAPAEWLAPRRPSPAVAASTAPTTSTPSPRRSRRQMLSRSSTCPESPLRSRRPPQ